MTQRGPVPQALPHEDLDYTHYIEKQLKPIVDAVLHFFGQSFNDIVGGRQLQVVRVDSLETVKLTIKISILSTEIREYKSIRADTCFIMCMTTAISSYV